MTRTGRSSTDNRRCAFCSEPLPALPPEAVARCSRCGAAVALTREPEMIRPRLAEVLGVPPGILALCTVPVSENVYLAGAWDPDENLTIEQVMKITRVRTRFPVMYHISEKHFPGAEKKKADVPGVRRGPGQPERWQIPRRDVLNLLRGGAGGGQRQSKAKPGAALMGDAKRRSRQLQRSKNSASKK